MTVRVSNHHECRCHRTLAPFQYPGASDRGLAASDPVDSTVLVPSEFSAQVEGFSVAVAVRDHGIGIPTRDLERIFERFYRVDRTRSRATGGTGLGLAIVRHVAQAHQGEVSVESEEGNGSTFTLKLPLAAASRTVRRTRRSASDG